MVSQGSAPIVGATAAHIPSPPVSGFHIGPAFIHYYAVMYLIGIAAAIYITRRRWVRAGGDPELMYDVAMWAVPAGIIGGRIYFDITTPAYIPHVWYGVLAVWDGGLGIWGAIPVAVLVGIWRVRRFGGSITMAMDAVAPALLVAQGIGRIGNYFNKELFGGPTSLPWGLAIPVAYRPAGYTAFAYFQPTFLYELIWDFALAAFLVWLGHHAKIFAPGLFALYVTGYSAFRIFEESLRVDPSQHFLGLRLNMYVAIGLTLVGATWFYLIQRRGRRRVIAGQPAPELAAGNAQPSYQARIAQSDGVLAEAAAADDAGAEPAAGDAEPEPAAGTADEPEPATAAAEEISTDKSATD
ncbi:MAG: prolipoprotein diacylglyceryl transferase [Actinobacteria bacterium]|nr:prolipoprotein diacylglyceryl transferase [Actinomycetota bacterium]